MLTDERPPTPNELQMARLAAPFPGVLRRDGARGQKQFEYITAEMAMNRLDDVLGPDNWADDTFVIGECVVCKLTITLASGEQLTRTGASSFDEKPGLTRSSIVKGAFSDAFKIAAKKFGVGRYLKTKGRHARYAERIMRGARAVAEGAPPDPDDPETDPRGDGSGLPSESPGRGSGRTSEPPTSEEFPSRQGRASRPGSALFRMLCRENYSKDHMIQKANQFGEENAYPQKIIDWSQYQVNVFCEAYGVPLPDGVGPMPVRSESRAEFSGETR